jgi:hypothetical protein
MFSRILPRQIDNNFSGHWLAIALLAVVVLVKGAQGLSSIVMTHNVVTNADGIPVDNYSTAGADTVMALTAQLGLLLVVIALIGIVALIRYRGMIPLIFVVQLIAQLGSRVLLALNPIARSTETPMGFAGHPVGFWVNIAILGMTLLGFALSLANRSAAQQDAGRSLA